MYHPRIDICANPDELDLVETLYLLTGVCPSRRPNDSYGRAGIQLRAAFDRALSEGDLENAESILSRMVRRPGGLVWCANAERRLAYRRERGR